MAVTPNITNSFRLVSEERESVFKARRKEKGQPCFGLALSGGGVRSAIFCLGALQCFAKANILRHFDYASSVSGGGYIAASLQWWLTQRPNDYDVGKKFPYGTDLVQWPNESPNLSFLRWHSNYLAPGGGISIWSGIAVLLRTMLVSLLVWLPLTVLVMLAVQHWSMPSTAGLGMPAFAQVALAAMAFSVTVFLFLAAVAVVISILIPPETTDNREERIARAGKCAFWGVAGCIGGASVIFLVGDYRFANMDPPSKVIFVVSVALVIFGVFALLVAVLQFTNWLNFGVNYAYRRFFEMKAGFVFGLLLCAALVASLPIAAKELLKAQAELPNSPGILGVVVAFSGVASAIYGHFVQAQRILPRYATRWVATICGAVFLYALLLVAYILAGVLLHPKQYGISEGDAEVFQRVYWVVLVFSLIFGYVSNLNFLGLHRFYRDRLMEAFLPSAVQEVAGPPQYSDADRVPLADVWNNKKAPTVGRPYPIFNTNAILINDKKPIYALRGGDSFILSPLYMGSAATGWTKTAEFSPRNGALTLASAMAASGAAANANSAYIGSGITRDRLISIVMMILNMRLGLWIRKPGAKARGANYFWPGFTYGVMRSGYKSTSSFVELTDGGHFDNLGVYELIRRQADVIVVLDSEEDPETTMFALASVCQRVQEDFGVTIQIGDKADQIAPDSDMGYPGGAKFTRQSFFIAPVVYPVPLVGQPANKREGKRGVLVFLKSNMLKELSFPTKGYKAKNRDFPNQSTMDQFFEPAQFEAYRELGFSCASAFISFLKIDHATEKDLYEKVMKAI